MPWTGCSVCCFSLWLQLRYCSTCFVKSCAMDFSCLAVRYVMFTFHKAWRITHKYRLVRTVWQYKWVKYSLRTSCSAELRPLQNVGMNGCAWTEAHPAHGLVCVRSKRLGSRGRAETPASSYWDSSWISLHYKARGVPEFHTAKWECLGIS